MRKACRTANGADINFTKEYYKENIRQILENGKINDNRLLSAAQKDGRGNICPATIILPTLAMEAKKKAEKKGLDVVEEFFKILEVAIEDCKDELIERFNWISAQSPASAMFMYENNTLKGYEKEEGIKSALKHGTLAIGQIGLSETLIILIGENQLTDKGMKLAKRIEQLFKDKSNEYKKEWHYNKKISKEEIFKELALNIENRTGKQLTKEEEKEIMEYIKANTPADLIS